MIVIFPSDWKSDYINRFNFFLAVWLVARQSRVFRHEAEGDGFFGSIGTAGSLFHQPSGKGRDNTLWVIRPENQNSPGHDAHDTAPQVHETEATANHSKSPDLSFTVWYTVTCIINHPQVITIGVVQPIPKRIQTVTFTIGFITLLLAFGNLKGLLAFGND